MQAGVSGAEATQEMGAGGAVGVYGNGSAGVAWGKVVEAGAYGDQLGKGRGVYSTLVRMEGAAAVLVDAVCEPAPARTARVSGGNNGRRHICSKPEGGGAIPVGQERAPGCEITEDSGCELRGRGARVGRCVDRVSEEAGEWERWGDEGEQTRQPPQHSGGGTGAG